MALANGLLGRIQQSLARRIEDADIEFRNGFQAGQQAEIDLEVIDSELALRVRDGRAEFVVEKEVLVVRSHLQSAQRLARFLFDDGPDDTHAGSPPSMSVGHHTVLREPRFGSDVDAKPNGSSRRTGASRIDRKRHRIPVSDRNSSKSERGMHPDTCPRRRSDAKPALTRSVLAKCVSRKPYGSSTSAQISDERT